MQHDECQDLVPDRIASGECAVSSEVNSVARPKSPSVAESKQNVELMASVVHDMKTPLAIIVGATFLLKGPRLLSEDEKQFWLNDIERQTRRIDALLHDLLDTMQIDLMSMPLRLEPFDFSAMVREAICDQSTAEPDRIILFNTTTRSLIVGDRTRLIRAVANLLSNAVKYSASSAVVEVEAIESEGTIVLRVQDHGIGMSQAERNRLFQPCFRAKPAAAMAHGSGLGLLSVKQIVEAHGGTLTIASEAGEGTIVEVTLPTRGAPRSVSTQVWQISN